MLSSTSSSSQSPVDTGATPTIHYRRWIAITTACLVLFCVSLEAVTRLTFRHISHIESRIASTYDEARTLKRTPGKQTILFLGNSLPLEGIDMSQLSSALGSRALCVPFFIEQTQYLDWYFGLRRLFSEGSNPDIVVLSMSIPHLMSSVIRGDYSAFYLFRVRDFPEIKRDTNANLTTMSGLFLSRFSLFYAGRTPLRNFLLNKIDPAYGELLHGLSNQPAAYANAATADELLAERLGDLCSLATGKGVRFVFLLPPGFGPNENALVASGRRAGAQVLIPIHLNALPRDQFRDGFHLNKQGSSIFTRRLAQDLTNYLNTAASQDHVRNLADH